MEEVESYRKTFTVAMRLLLMRWNQWVAEDEIRAMTIGFDCFNTEISINLLTDRERQVLRLAVDEQMIEVLSAQGRGARHQSFSGTVVCRQLAVESHQQNRKALLPGCS